MKRQKLGTTIIWTVCLLGMAALVWSRQPLGGSRQTKHPPLALAAEQPAPSISAAPTNQAPVDNNSQPRANTPNAAVDAEPADPPQRQPVATEPRTLPVGVWVRENDPYKMTIELKGHELHATISGVLEEEDGVQFELRLNGEYHVTQDSMLYGVISSGELRTAGSEAEQRFEANAFVATCFYDQPFAFRYRLDPDALTIKELKMGAFPSGFDDVAELVKLVPGRFYPGNSTDADSRKDKVVLR